MAVYRSPSLIVNVIEDCWAPYIAQYAPYVICWSIPKKVSPSMLSKSHYHY